MSIALVGVKADLSASNDARAVARSPLPSLFDHKGHEISQIKLELTTKKYKNPLERTGFPWYNIVEFGNNIMKIRPSGVGGMS